MANNSNWEVNEPLHLLKNMKLACCVFQVGKLNNEPIYKTVSGDTLVEPSLMEYYVHSPYLEYFKRAYNKHIQT